MAKMDIWCIFSLTTLAEKSTQLVLFLGTNPGPAWQPTPPPQWGPASTCFPAAGQQLCPLAHRCVAHRSLDPSMVFLWRPSRCPARYGISGSRRTSSWLSRTSTSHPTPCRWRESQLGLRLPQMETPITTYFRPGCSLACQPTTEDTPGMRWLPV